MALEKVGAIWNKFDKKGNPMLSLKIGEESFLAFVNSYKDSDRHPDFQVYRVVDEVGQSGASFHTPLRESEDALF